MKIPSVQQDRSSAGLSFARAACACLAVDPQTVLGEFGKGLNVVPVSHMSTLLKEEA